MFRRLGPSEWAYCPVQLSVLEFGFRWIQARPTQVHWQLGDGGIKMSMTWDYERHLIWPQASQLMHVPTAHLYSPSTVKLRSLYEFNGNPFDLRTDLKQFFKIQIPIQKRQVLLGLLPKCNEFHAWEFWSSNPTSSLNRNWRRQNLCCKNLSPAGMPGKLPLCCTLLITHDIIIHLCRLTILSHSWTWNTPNCSSWAPHKWLKKKKKSLLIWCRPLVMGHKASDLQMHC